MLSIKLVEETVSESLLRLGPDIKDEVTAELGVVGEDVEELAKMLVPVRTGYLQSTIYHRVENMVLEVGATAHYAVYVECGTSRMAARPYLRPAVEASREKLMDAVKLAVMKVLKG